jgi:hypothetical protein
MKKWIIMERGHIQMSSCFGAGKNSSLELFFVVFYALNATNMPYC